MTPKQGKRVQFADRRLGGLRTVQLLLIAFLLSFSMTPQAAAPAQWSIAQSRHALDAAIQPDLPGMVPAAEPLEDGATDFAQAGPLPTAPNLPQIPDGLLADRAAGPIPADQQSGTLPLGRGPPGLLIA